MPLFLYKGGSTLHQSEQEILSIIIKDLKERYDHSDEFCFLFVGYTCNSKQFDATLIKSDAIINVEVKNFTGHKIIVSIQGDLIEEARQRRLGQDRDKYPITQVENQNHAIKNFIFEHQTELCGGKVVSTTNEIDVCGCVLLRKISEINSSALGNKSNFLRVTDCDKFWKDVSTYKGREFGRRNLPLNLDEDFVKELAKLLDLKQIKDLNVVVGVDTEFELKIRDYLYGINFEVDYVDRPEIENQLLAEKNILAIGAPGAGKSTTLKKLIKDYAQQELGKSQFTRIPCLLKMGRVIPNELSKEITRELGLSEEQVEQKLNEGLFWIVFDAVDEMQNFQEKFRHLINFVKDYPKNRYLISVRREKYQYLKEDEDFEQLSKNRRFNEFVEVEIPQLTKEQQVALVLKRLGDHKSIENQKIIELFLAKLPEILPLPIEMAVEIYLNNGILVYENEGRWFEEFFKAKLKRESKKLTALGRDTDVLLDKVLTKIGKHDIEECDSYYEKALVHRFLKEELGDNFLEFYDLLLKSEILELIKVTITVGKIKRNDEQLKFYHKTYRDFYAAKALIGDFSDTEWLEIMLDDTDEYRTLVMLCGIEKKTVKVDSIIKNAIDKGNFELACECLFNAGNYSSEIQGYVAKEIIQRSEEDNNFKNNRLIELVLKYGERILVLELHKYLDSLEKDDIIQRIDWEVYKSEKLGFGEIPEKYQHTMRYSYRHKKIIPPFFIDHNNWSTETLSEYLESSRVTQSEEIFRAITTKELMLILLSIITDEKYSDKAVVWMIEPLQYACSNAIISQREVIKKIIDSEILFKSKSEYLRCKLLPFLLMDFTYQEPDFVSQNPDIELMLINLFKQEVSPIIKLRILYNSAWTMSSTEARNLCTDILIGQEVYCDEELMHKPIAGDLILDDFENESFETLLKCRAIDNIVNIGRNYIELNGRILPGAVDKIVNNYKDVFRYYVLSENEKIRTVSEYALNEIEKQRSESQL